MAIVPYYHNGITYNRDTVTNQVTLPPGDPAYLTPVSITDRKNYILWRLQHGLTVTLTNPAPAPTTTPSEPVTTTTPTTLTVTGGYVPISFKEGVTTTPTTTVPTTPVTTQAPSYVPINIKEPSYNTNIQPTPTPTQPTTYTPTVIPVYKEPTPVTSGATGGYVPLTAKEVEQQTIQTVKASEVVTTTGGYVPITAPKIEQVTPYENYVKAVTEVQQAPQGTIIGSSSPIIISQVSPSQQEYEKFSKLSPMEKYVKILGTAAHNPIDFFGETPKFIYSKLTGDTEAQQGYWNNYLYKEIERMNTVKTPLDRVLYTVESPFTQAAVFSGGTYGLGYLKGVSGVTSGIATGIERGLGAYFTTELAKGGVTSYQQGTLPSYLYKTGLTVGLIAGISGGFSQTGELAGFRKYQTGMLKTEAGKAQLQTQYKAIEGMQKFSSEKPVASFDITKVLGDEQALRFTKAMDIAKKENITVIHKGSGVLETYGIDLTKPVHDIDISVMQKTALQSPIKIASRVLDTSSGDVITSGGVKLQSPFGKISQVSQFKDILREQGVDLSKFDFLEAETPGSPFNTKGIGFTEPPIRTAKGSVFEYQMRLSELGTRAIKETIAPEISMRGKDWTRTVDIMSQKFNEPVVEMKPSSYAKMLEQQGIVDLFSLKPGKPSPQLKYVVEDIQTLGITIGDTAKIIKPEIGVKRFLSPNLKQETYAHELIHMEPYLRTGRMASEAEAYGLESSIKFYKPTLDVTLSKYQPELKPGTYEMIGPSYYQRYPFEAPKSEFTFFEKIIRKYGEPMTTMDLWKTPPKDVGTESFMKAEPFRPQFITKGTKTPAWAKGTTFFSSMITTGTKATKYDPFLTSLGAGVIRANYPSTLQTKPTSFLSSSQTIRYPSGYSKDISTILSGGTSFYTPEKYTPTKIIKTYSPSIIDYTPTYPSTKTPYTPSYTPSPSTPYTTTYTPPRYTPTPPYTPSTPTYTPPYTPSPPTYTPTTPYTPSSPKRTYTPYTPYEPTYTPPPTEITPRIPDYSGRGREKQHDQGFNVYVKDRTYVKGEKKIKERWIKANPSPLTEGQAMSLGATAVDNSAAASFRVTQASGKPGSLKIGVQPWNTISDKFYNKKGTYIESTHSRIDSTGEIQGISALGWIANQQRSYAPTMPTTKMLSVKPLRIDYGAPQTTRMMKTTYTTPDFTKMLRGLGM